MTYTAEEVRQEIDDSIHSGGYSGLIAIANTYAADLERRAATLPPAKPLPDLMLASYHEAVGWNAYRAALIAALPIATSVTDAMVDAMGATLYIYWNDVSTWTRKNYAAKIRTALTAALTTIHAAEPVTHTIHQPHCNLLHPATMGTDEDHCDCRPAEPERVVNAAQDPCGQVNPPRYSYGADGSVMFLNPEDSPYTRGTEPVQAVNAAQAKVITQIMSDAIHTSRADPDKPDTICISAVILHRILEQHLFTPADPLVGIKQ